MVNFDAVKGSLEVKLFLIYTSPGNRDSGNIEPHGVFVLPNTIVLDRAPRFISSGLMTPANKIPLLIMPLLNEHCITAVAMGVTSETGLIWCTDGNQYVRLLNHMPVSCARVCAFPTPTSRARIVPAFRTCSCTRAFRINIAFSARRASDVSGDNSSTTGSQSAPPITLIEKSSWSPGKASRLAGAMSIAGPRKKSPAHLIILTAKKKKQGR